MPLLLIFMREYGPRKIRRKAGIGWQRKNRRVSTAETLRYLLFAPVGRARQLAGLLEEASHFKVNVSVNLGLVTVLKRNLTGAQKRTIS
jgi:hypothetical protein